MERTVEVDNDVLYAVDPLLWALDGIDIGRGERYSLVGHEYQRSLLEDESRYICVKKAAQMGVTLTVQLRVLHKLIYGIYPQGVYYAFPTVKQVEQFSKLRFTPLLERNEGKIGRYVSTDSAFVKKVGGANLVFVGAGSSVIEGTNARDNASLRSFEADCVVYDEYDLHDKFAVEQLLERCLHSKIKAQIAISTPTFPGHGIDRLYSQSSMGVWQIKCSVCGRYTCLEREFPKCIDRVGGELRRVCIHCRRPIRVSDGHWEDEVSGSKWRGYWISQFSGPYVDFEDIMDRYENPPNGTLTKFYNSIWGLARADSEHQLSGQTVYSCCGNESIISSSKCETVMGVDVGKVLHVVIGIRTGKESYQVLGVYRVNSFEDLGDLARRCRVRYAVVDAMPETHAVREFSRVSPFTVYRCQYSEYMLDRPQFDGEAGLVKCNRNEMCDKVHTVVSTRGQLLLPRRSAEIDEYVNEMTNIAKYIVENPDTGVSRPRWRGDNDHYFHATLYFLLAASRAGIISNKDIDGNMDKRYKYSINEYIL